MIKVCPHAPFSFSSLSKHTYTCTLLHSSNKKQQPFVNYITIMMLCVCIIEILRVQKCIVLLCVQDVYMCDLQKNYSLKILLTLIQQLIDTS